MIRIAHVSDFHINDEDLFGTRNEIVVPLIEDLEKYKDERDIDLVICSGDLIDRAGTTFDSPKHAFKTFEVEVAEKIISLLELSRSQFIMCPGNHDVVADLDNGYNEDGLKSNLTSEDEITNYILQDEQTGRDRMTPYLTFEESFYDKAELNTTDFESTIVFEKEGVTVGIAALNSAWRCWPHDSAEEHLLIGERQVLRAAQSLGDVDLAIAVAHHPVEVLRSFDRDRVSNSLQREFDMFFCGDVHKGATSTTQVRENALFVSVAPAITQSNVRSDSRTYANGYCIIDFDPVTREITVHNRRYSSKKHQFDPNADLGDAAGKAKYNLPSDADRQIYQKAQSICERVSEQCLPKLNRNLVTAGTDTDAPSSLKEIFVMPEVVRRQRVSSTETEIEDVKETRLSLEDLATKRKDFLLLGEKEVGKSSLLNRLAMELSENYKRYGQIPVLIDFSELNNRKIKSEVGDFLGVRRRDIEELADSYNLTLLIDNITFQDEDEYRLRRVCNFAKKHENTRVVATHLQTHSGELPMGHTSELRLKPLEIKLFRTQQIRSLVENWFSTGEPIDTPSQIDNIVSLFQALDIPRTPLAASIFLWIIEKQEHYEPKNKATMVENFVERLLQKHSRKEALSGRFDFTNKVFLLSKLSYLMLQAEKRDYRLRYSGAVKCVEDHLKGRDWDDEFSGKEILDSLIEGGILDNSGQYVRFRFQCFFEYFLAKRMEQDTEFKEFVISDRNYLMFDSEIRYYTGIRRNCSDILDTVSSRALDLYSDLEESLLEEGQTYDNVMERGGSRVSSMDAADVLKQVEDKRPSEKDLDALQDQKMELAAPEQGIARKSKPDHPLEELSRCLFLAAEVLKNTEETDQSRLKSKAYSNVIQCALAYTVLYKLALSKYLDEEGDSLPEEFREVAQMMTDYAPIVVQVSLHESMGTKKLNGVFKNDFKPVLDGNEEATDLQLFLSVFLYAENKGNRYFKYIEDFIYHMSSKYTEDLVFFKLLTYLYLRSRSKDLDNTILDLMAEVFVKAKDLPASHKGKIIEKYKKKKLLRKASGNGDSQKTLDF
ncbi:hypothetical protein CRI93_08550 [Longimonas halophila]|uniref:Uncharacterized protein n=1 Tax=Longimonas halophila TaxID=1469170 RepID=A0A2H3NNW0_9BACT|nr:metallophosphoesterase [Longimonas halophila]PEN06683.1 hypothetical protein CRI93_08550 [Longimonas halophila]